MAMAKRPNKTRKAENKKASEGKDELGGKEYERELARLHGELVKLQLWVVAKGLKVVVLFEGRDGAGKGGVIKAITERVSPRGAGRLRPCRRPWTPSSATSSRARPPRTETQRRASIDRARTHR